MDFFDRQRQARGTTLKLVVLFALAVIALVAVMDLVVFLLVHRGTSGSGGTPVVGYLIASSVGTVLIIAGGMATKTIALRAGGSAVALSVGAVAVDPSTSDPQLRRFVNIVEEMSIAAGVPMPRLFVLENEPGINAFAAGYTPADAAITVTGGALRSLNRDELQGVIGHEFSHILNGDMRLNIRLIGVLNGILLLGLFGLRMLWFSGGSRSRNNNVNPILVIAFAMMALGFVGQFFASLIKAAVSRQREWLADASSVQFTRQTTGLEGAFKKIAGLPAGSSLTKAHDASQISHMLFGEAGGGFAQLFASHPPLLARIRALDPTFDPRQVEALQQQWHSDPPNGLAEDAARGLVDTGVSAALGSAPAAAPSPVRAAVAPADVSARVGTMTPADVARGGELSDKLPDDLLQLARQASTALPLVVALALNPEPDVRAKQLATVTAELGAPTAAATTSIAARLDGLDPQYRLPLLDLAAPLVAARPHDELGALMKALGDLALADGRVSLYEYCLTRLMSAYLADALDPVRRSRPGRGSVAGARDAALNLLAALAAEGNDDEAGASAAFAAGLATLLPGTTLPFVAPADTWHALDAGWPILDAVERPQKQKLVEAMVAAVRADGRLTLHEAELLRTACRLLHCPVPAFAA